MREKTNQEDLMVRYLLGELTEEEQEQIEARFLTDNQYFEQLCSVEDALIDDYVQDTLAEDERKKVGTLLLSSPRQAREIDFVRDLIRQIGENPSTELKQQSSIPVKRSARLRLLLELLRIKAPRRRLSFAVTCLLIVSGLSLAVWNLSLLRKIGEMENNQAVLEKRGKELQQQISGQEHEREAAVKELEDERKRREQLEQELSALEESRSPIPMPEIAAIDLNADSFSRNEGELRVVRIHPGLSRLRIRINLDKESDYKSYSAAINTFDGKRIWSKDRASAGQENPGRIILTVPASNLVNGDYTLTLKGQTEAGDIVDIGDYSFRVKKGR